MQSPFYLIAHNSKFAVSPRIAAVSGKRQLSEQHISGIYYIVAKPLKVGIRCPLVRMAQRLRDYLHRNAGLFMLSA